MRECGRQQAQSSHQHGHHDGPKPPHGSFDRGVFNRISACTQLVDVLHHDYAGLNRGAEQSQEANARRHAEVRTGDVQSEQTADPRHGHVDQMEAGPLCGSKGGINDQEDEEDGRGHDDHQPCLGAFLALILARPFDAVKRWQLYLLLDLAHGFLHRAAQITAAHAVVDGDIAGTAFTIKLRSAVPHFDLAKLRQRNALAGR